jgi:hypothetical protein
MNDLNETKGQNLANFSKILLKTYLISKCTSLCFTAKKLDFNDCLDNCNLKVISVFEVFENINQEYKKGTR